MWMRAAFVTVGIVLAAPAVAQADPLCPLSDEPITPETATDPNGPYAYQGIIGFHIVAGEAAARQALGAQYGGLWMDTPRQGWSIAFSPGPLDAAAARAAILDRIPAASAAILAPRLNVLPTPYSEAELEAIRPALMAIFQGHTDILSSFGVTCNGSDGFRVEVAFVDPETPQLKATAEALFAQFGDKVYIVYGRGRAVPAGPGILPIMETGVAPPLQDAGPRRVRRFVTLPPTVRCVRGRTVGARAGKQVRSVTLAAGKRRATGKRPRLKLAARKTKVTVTVKLRDGSTATQTFTYRRC